MPNKRKTVALIGIMAVVLLPVAVPNLLCLFEGGFRFSPIWNCRSPDGTDEVVVYRRIVFPYLDFTDPPIVVKVVLQGRSSASYALRLREDSNLQEPEVVWTEKLVALSNLSTEDPTLITLGRTTSEK